MSIVERRTTKQRELILDIVRHAHTHPAAEEVYHQAKRKLKTISLGTVYRNLNFLVEEGLIREVQFPGSVSRYDGMLDPHEHFVCTKCGSVTDIPSTLKKKDLAKPQEMIGSGTIQSYRLDYYGLCENCNS